MKTIREVYETYLKIPLPTKQNWQTNPIYQNRWGVKTGIAFTPPHPYRYYTFSEFCFKYNKEEEFANQFPQIS